MAKFLPPEAKGVTYAIQNSAQATFAAEAQGFMQEVATKMAVEAVNDVGRIPSLLSRAYNFYIDLFPEQYAGHGAEQRPGRLEARQRARRALRGIITVLALRDVLGLKIELRKFKPIEGYGAGSVNPYRAVFADAYGEAPEFGKSDDMDPDGSASAFRELRYLVVRTPVGLKESKGASGIGGLWTPDGLNESRVEFKEEPLCGLSPLTLFFPAGAPMKYCNNIFWYDNATGEWLDPTTDWTGHRDTSSPSIDVDYNVILSIRGCMIRWLDKVIQAGPQLAWVSFGIRGNRANRLQEELTAWLGDLRKRHYLSPPKGLQKEDARLEGMNIKNSDGQRVTVPILEQKAVWDPAQQRSELPGVLSQLPTAKGRILLSNKILNDRNIRICGRLRGGEMLAASLQTMPPEGESFVLHDGSRSYVIPEPYVIVDKLFLDCIHLVADGPISDNFSAMTPSASEHEQWWLFPFKPQLLRYLDLDELRKKGGGNVVKCSRSGGSANNLIEVTVYVGGIPFTRQYDATDCNQTNRDMAGNALDIRIWPNFRFLTTPKLPREAGDRIHYFRIRQQPAWELQTQILARRVKPTEPSAEKQGTASTSSSTGNSEASGPAALTAVEVFNPKTWDQGWPDELDANAFRLARCHAFPAQGCKRASDGQVLDGEWEPVGLVFDGRGLCLFTLEEPVSAPHGQATPLKIGVDFGTSNTCVAAAVDSATVEVEPKEIRFEVQTTSLHRFSTYEDVAEQLAQGLPTEGAAAVLDFPYKYGDERFVIEAAYFPTQVVTKLPEGASMTDNVFLMSNGLIFARNLLDSKDIVSMLYNYPPIPLPDRRPFRLVPDPKWANRAYRKAFLWHLYKMIVYHAARNRAEIKTAAFSFPRAFNKDVVDGYWNQLLAIFSHHGQIQSIRIITESDAVHQWMAKTVPAAHPLVLDVGGGSTDFLGLFQQRRFQASYEFAAGFVNRYFSASPRFQKAFDAAIQRVVPLHEAGTLKGNQERDRRKLVKDLFAGANPHAGLQPTYSEQAFFRMLGMMEDKHYPAMMDVLREVPQDIQHEPERKAICGFFYTAVLLYTGLVYQAGRLMCQHGIGTANVELKFIGNGSRFYRFLEHVDVHFSKVLRGIFYTGYQQQPSLEHVLEPEGKTLVAKGLLVPMKDDKHGRAKVTEDMESHSYLMALANDSDPKPPMQPDFPDLHEFLRLLNQELPAGQLDGLTIIPYCAPNLATELEELFKSIVVAVWERELSKARQLKRDWEQSELLARTNLDAASPLRDSALATEPRFIIRLKCLLNEIRKQYAN